ncbi:MAG: hypothetical protein ACR2RA_04040 [Geminicoccaceae bacterium]
MSADRARVRASSIVGLYQDVAIESLPIEEVKADLERLGVDPTLPIELAKRLAEGDADDPATVLLRKLEEADEIDAEIADLESAPIDEIRSNLPEVLAEQAAAIAKERSGEGVAGEIRTTEDVEKTNVVPVRRRRFASVGWSGSLVGIAASVALFIAVRPYVSGEMKWADQLRSPIERQLAIEKNDQAADTTAAAGRAEIAEATDGAAVEAKASASPNARSRSRQPLAVAPSPATDQRRPLLETAAAEADGEDAAGDQGPAPSGAEREELAGLPAAERVLPSISPDEPPEAVRLAQQDAADDDQRSQAASADGPEIDRAAASPTHLPTPRPAPTARELAALITAKVRARAPTAEPTESEAPSAADISSVPGLPDDVTGVFVVDADGVPPELWALASVRPDDRLAAKVGEASLRALGRKVLALVAFDRDGQRVEAVLVESAAAAPPADLASQAVTGVTAFAETGSQPLAAVGRSFELIELPSDG